MDYVTIYFFSALIISSGIILYQDFKERQVSLWALILFGINCLTSVLYYRDASILLYNSIGAVAYMSIIWLALKLYLYLKFRKNTAIIDQQLGMADVLVIFFIGITFNSLWMILFFCAGFIFSLFVFLVYAFFKKNNTQSIPLAGLLVFFYVVTIIVLNLIRFNPFIIDCSFII